jgi:hypothetical protein
MSGIYLLDTFTLSNDGIDLDFYKLISCCCPRLAANGLHICDVRDFGIQNWLPLQT